jgi:hypothetical protein
VTAGAAVAIVVGSFTLSPVAQAATRAGTGDGSGGTAATVSVVSHRAHMGDYAAASFATAAAKLPAGLAAQLHRQLGITPEQFLADGQAAADAGKVIAALRADGVTVFGGKLNGTALTVTVRDAAGAAAAEADGASAVIGTALPAKTVTAKAVSSPVDGTSHLLGGDLWAYLTDLSTGDGMICSTGFNGYNKSTGAKEFITAGHCGDYQDTGDPAPADGIVYGATDSDPVSMDTDPGVVYPTPSLGSMDQSSFHFGPNHADSGIVDVTDTLAKPAPAVTTWGGTATSTTASLGVQNNGTPVPVLGTAPAVDGAPVCHSGERTGWQCGTVDNGGYGYAEATVQTTSGTQTVDGFESNVCLLPGDSGGSFVSGEYAVGIASAGTFDPKSDSGPGNNTCAPGGFSIAYPMVAAVSGEESAALSEPSFELAVAVPTPVVSAATVNGVTGAGTIRGYLPRPFATGTRVTLSVDGVLKGTTTADSNGNWSFSPTGLALGVRHYTVTAGSGHSTAAVAKTLNVVPGTFTSVKAPGIGGAVRVGAKVVASPGTWSVAGTTFTYQWLANGVRITGATASSYTIPASLVGKKLSVTVTAHKSRYNNAARTSAAIVIGKGILALKVKPALTGTPAVGKRLAVTAGTWSPAAAITFQWYANGIPVSRATAASLLLSSSQRGKVISVTVTASKAGYATAAVHLTESARVR